VTGTGLKRPKSRFEIHINGLNATPDRAYIYEQINDGAVTSAGTGPVSMVGTNWDQDHRDWCIVGAEFPAGMSGVIKSYFRVPGVTGPVTTNVHTIVGDWSAIALDSIGYQMWRRSGQNQHNQIAWFWIGALTDDWPT
jgi:hypothetical protein